jgi:Fungal specific transcription factor domain
MPAVGFIPVRDDANGSSDDETTDNPPFGNFSIASISNTMSNLNLSTGGHFYGRSSVFMHIQAAVDRKFEYLSTKMEGEQMPPIEELLHFRPEYWQPNPWELVHAPKRQLHEFEFPPNDLLDSLVNIYFLSNNCHFPLLHRPTFEQNYRSGLHETSAPFAEILLLVCAIASRCCDDPRVLLDPAYPHSAGWKYYEQVNVTDRSLVMPPTLLDLQSYVLAAWYLLESSCNYAAWALTGIGLRMAQDVGAHRKKVYRNPMALEDESWKRAFWCLIAIDRLASSTMGRIPAIYDSE